MEPPFSSSLSCRRRHAARSKTLRCHPSPDTSASQVAVKEWLERWRLVEIMRTDCEQPGLVRLATGKGEISGTKYMKSATALGAACSAPKPRWIVGPLVSSAPKAGPTTVASRSNSRRKKEGGRRKKQAGTTLPLSSVPLATQHIIRYDGIRRRSLTFLPSDTTPNKN